MSSRSTAIRTSNGGRLRAEAPVHYYPDSAIPYWAITRHAHVTEIGRNPDTFLNGPKLVVNPNMVEDENADFVRPKTLIEHGQPAAPREPQARSAAASRRAR